MSQPLPYFASGLALALLSTVLTLRAKRPADLSPQCPPPSVVLPQAAPPAPAVAVIEAKAPTKLPPSTRPFDRMADGSAVPPLAADAPKRVRLGVALFRFKGAEGAGPNERGREAALAAAQSALGAAPEGFRRAIAKADPGSNEDIGWVQRGVLEKRVEHAVFQLKPGDLAAEPVETPRGYWVVRRIK